MNTNYCYLILLFLLATQLFINLTNSSKVINNNKYQYSSKNDDDLEKLEPGLKGACKNQTINVVQNFNITKYLGIWFEIGHSESFAFDRSCSQTQAEYTILDEKQNLIQVNNTCLKSQKGFVSAIGKAMSAENNTGHLKVSFFVIFLHHMI